MHHIPIKDWVIPSRAQIQQFLSIVNTNISNNQATYVHCIGGCGRTGTMLAMYLINSGKTGFESLEQVRENLEIWSQETPRDIVERVRREFQDIPEKILNPSLWL